MTDVRRFLADLGATDDEIAAAERDGSQALQMLAIDRLMLGGPKRYTGPETARLAGLPEDDAKRYWRALGFVDVPDDEIAFTDADVAALASARAVVEHGFAEQTGTLQVTRVVGQTTARIADALTALTAARAERVRREEGTQDVEARLLEDARQLLPINEAFLAYAFHRHLAASAKRRVAAGFEASAPELAVGFCDLVGFTKLARQVEEAELGEIVERFETVAYDVIGAVGGRLVKMIGDEVMFVAPTVPAGAEIALRLSEEHGRDPQIPDCRIGLAFGQVLPREGDYFGETVNLAARVQAVALPRTVLVSQQAATALRDTPEYEVRPIRHRHLKGVGRTKLWALRRPGA